MLEISENWDFFSEDFNQRNVVYIMSLENVGPNETRWVETVWDVCSFVLK